jgi:hypothetical protein
MAKPKIETLVEQSLIKSATLKDRVKAGLQYARAQTDVFSVGGPTDSYRYILMEIVRNRQRQPSANYPN